MTHTITAPRDIRGSRMSAVDSKGLTPQERKAAVTGLMADLEKLVTQPHESTPMPIKDPTKGHGTMSTQVDFRIAFPRYTGEPMAKHA